ncbi:MAG: SRPBCC family protein [Terracidiphilus sp.]
MRTKSQERFLLAGESRLNWRSNMATSSITPDSDAIVSEITIDAPLEDVFRALVDPALVTKWWGGRGAGQSFRCTNFECDLRPGGKWRSTGIGANGLPFEATGEYLEIDPPRLLVYTWSASWASDVKTTVRWELLPTQQGTLVRHRHSGLAAHPEIGKSFRGWPRLLAWLKALLEKGETVEDRWQLTSDER